MRVRITIDTGDLWWRRHVPQIFPDCIFWLNHVGGEVWPEFVADYNVFAYGDFSIPYYGKDTVVWVNDDEVDFCETPDWRVR